MTQATDYMSFADADVEYSLDGTTWVSCSGDTLGFAWGGGELQKADTHTGDSDKPLVTFGKFGSLEVTVRGLFAGTAGTDALSVAETAYRAKSAFYLRCFPEGKTVGNRSYTSTEGRVTKPTYPGGAFNSPDAIAADITISCADVVPGTYSTT